VNYRHAFHAGNFADVVKHVLLVLAVTHLKAKDKPFFVLDTHAGRGLYDLRGEQAGRTGEWRDGIGRLLALAHPPPGLAPYLDAVRAVGSGLYPGSPRLVQRLLRTDDRLFLCELHPEDAAVLRIAVGRDERVKVETRDGYAALKAVLPPKERRGLVLIDPPFERRDEFAACERALREGVKRWASGTFAVWYPIKDPLEVAAFHARVADMGLGKTWHLDLYIRAAVPGRPRLDGCGFLFVNPPWPVLDAAEGLLPDLADVLAQGEGAGVRHGWLGNGD
jgi:23S rRNA (adenine2030-N6)-methyltransferase